MYRRHPSTVFIKATSKYLFSPTRPFLHSIPLISIRFATLLKPPSLPNSSTPFHQLRLLTPLTHHLLALNYFQTFIIMAKHEENRAVRLYHGFIAILLLLGGGALIGAGIWLRVSDKSIPRLDYTGSTILNWAVSSAWAAIIVGCFLIITAVISLFALGRNCLGTTFKVIYIILALVILAFLVFVCVVAAIIRARGSDDNVKNALSDAWENTVVGDRGLEDNTSSTCGIERNLNCRGFTNNDCLGCETAGGCLRAQFCANCTGTQPLFETGCYDRILDRFNDVFLPAAIVTGILAAMVLLDVFITCCL